jgi:hypothetical protein
MHYTEKAKYVQKSVDELIDILDHYVTDEPNLLKARKLIGHIVSSSVSAVPRAVQHTVRRTIVEVAVGKHCDINMHTEMKEDGYKYHIIDITPKEIPQQRDTEAECCCDSPSLTALNEEPAS